MANPERGEVELVLPVNGDGGAERRYTLRMSTNAICELQARTKKTYGELLNDLSRVDYVSLRELVFSLLQRYHRKDFDTMLKVGDLIDDAGGLAGLMPTLTQLFRLNAPQDKAAEISGEDASTGGASDPQ